MKLYVLCWRENPGRDGSRRPDGGAGAHVPEAGGHARHRPHGLDRGGDHLALGKLETFGGDKCEVKDGLLGVGN